MTKRNTIVKFRYAGYAYPFKVLRFRKLMKNAPYWDEQRLRTWSWQARMAIVDHAIRYVKYYGDHHGEVGRELLRGADPSTWCHLPTIDKHAIVQAPESFISTTANPRRCTWTHTSGSSGTKLDILLDDNVNSAAFALFWRAWESGGYWRLGQRHAVMKAPTSARGWKLNRKIRALEISSSHVRAEMIQELRDRLVAYGPRFMRGYPSALYLFCQLLKEKGLSIRIPMVIGGSETLHAFQRREFEETLGARVYNHYTHWERAASILECDKGRLHAQEDYGFHELLDSSGMPVPPGVPGEITATSLHNLAMPFIRYRTGDVGVWDTESCDCGQTFPVIRSIEGRLNDSIVKRDGTVISGTYAVGGFIPNTYIVAAQLVQDDYDTVEVRIVKAASYREPEHTEDIVRDLNARLGKDVRLILRYCSLDDLAKSPAGKVRQCLNRIPDLDTKSMLGGARWSETKENRETAD